MLRSAGMLQPLSSQYPCNAYDPWLFVLFLVRVVLKHSIKSIPANKRRWKASVTLVKCMKKTVLFPLSVGLLLVLVGVIGAIVPSYFENSETLSSFRLKRFSSYEELKTFLNTTLQGNYPYHIDRWGLQPSPTFLTSNLARSGAESASSVPEFSTTNIQVEGVDEADIIKTDGEYIYVISENNITIVKAYPPAEAEILSQIRVNGTLAGMFINGDRLVVFEQKSPYYMYRTLSDKPTAESYIWRAVIKVYNIADRANPVSMRNVTVDGGYFDSRMIGDYVYAVINQPAYYFEGEVPLPKISSDDFVKEISPLDIYYSNVSDYGYSFTTIVAVNVQNDTQEPTVQPFLFGATSNMYVSTSNIYITLLNTTNIIQPAVLGQPNIPQTLEKTIIHRIHIENGEITYASTGEVPGYVLNQFSMDEHNDHFRIATTTGEVWGWGQSTSKNHVYILDSGLNTVGRLEDLVPGEKIYSARFMGDRGYLVTFKKIDPLFVLDLSDPEDPKVLGELEITGYSDYLHPYDETHIIGIGKETIEGEGGNFAWYQGVKISLFDVSDVGAPKEIAKYEIGDRGTDSPILSDHKAFLFDKSKNLLVIPVTVAEIDPAKYPGDVPPYAYGDPVWDGAYVFHISLEGGLTLQGRITHFDDAAELMKSGYYYHSPYSVKRSLYIDDVLYTISDRKIKMNSLLDLGEIGELDLNA